MAKLDGKKKLLFSALLLLGVVAVLEVSSALALRVRDGSWPSPSRFREERERVAGVASAADAPPAADASDQVLHPFLGFVQDPAVSQPYWAVDVQGFPVVPPPAEVAGPEQFDVAVFGGSVANGFCFGGRSAFRRVLAESPLVRGKAIAIHCFALGGFKQPQQLMALNWALSLGAQFDLAINLDGFNEVALSVAENAKVHTHPLYPRWWPARVAGIQAASTMRILGTIELLAEERRERAGLCGPSLLAWSPTCHLAWSALDRSLASRLAAAQRQLGAEVPRRKSFLTRGPRLESWDESEIYPLIARHWAESSSLMFELCRARGIPYFHFLQPNQYLAGSKPMGREERRIAIDPDQIYRPPVEKGYPLLIAAGRTLAARGVPYFDLTGIFLDHPEPLYSDSCCHYTRPGNLLLAETIGKIVVRGLPAP